MTRAPSHLYHYQAVLSRLAEEGTGSMRLSITAVVLAAAFGISPSIASVNPQSEPGHQSGQAAPHFEGASGDGLIVHRPLPVRGVADAREAPHLDNGTDGPTPHQTGPEPRGVSTGPAPHLDNGTDGPTPHIGSH
jgi:hypothetical protein